MLLFFFIVKNYNRSVRGSFSPNQFIDIYWFFSIESLSYFVSRFSCPGFSFFQATYSFLLYALLTFCYWKPSSLCPDFTEDPGKWQWLRLSQGDFAYCLDLLQVSPDRRISSFICTRLPRACAEMANLIVCFHWYWLWGFFTRLQRYSLILIKSCCLSSSCPLHTTIWAAERQVSWYVASLTLFFFFFFNSYSLGLHFLTKGKKVISEESLTPSNSWSHFS